MKFQAQVKLSGPLFTAEGPTRLGRVVNLSIRELVEMGEERLANKLRAQGSSNLQDDTSGVFKTKAEAGKQASVGTYLRSISTRYANFNAVISDGTLYGPWLEGISSRNQTTRFKGYSQFRFTQQYIDKNAKPVVQKNLNEFVRRMNA